ncbi:class I SAM-dependent methyltransferase [Lutimaribacter sp. EGI FJ00015]|uniref:Class I SAM-dependent methyltransferase n=1 Tax=Lutimaribacter degradans TaxID=2945989 RepID=A0ACC5ZRN4_9RHOB|nr:class I SAM-dependent methyltransferase [Lutimaribacter sp. EGI FJ00013]MCM2560974.1 class I SAM-dependent methyltransferase [Lutimaribacter sp. EGI FJ00013]MCO0612079.1 class I SAM-dependent methyltransferase [Lutimaribacter sp. EGI FJ00015]MCO0634801.1 class I SAM-dependent methyltransferase [Lutimaribacter sp. EGI FJ00014]
MWEDRFNTPDYVFGTAPAQFLRDHQDWLVTGHSALSVADGEGRNSVFMAQQGLDVTALEYAPSAIEKARKLAARHGVRVDFQQVDVLAHDWPDSYDLVVGIFIQFVGPTDRARLFDGMQRSVKPGGVIMLHGYTPKQLEHGTGGPPHAENMYTPEILAAHFDGWEVTENRTYEREVQEGRGHSGMSALIDFIARKPG